MKKSHDNSLKRIAKFSFFILIISYFTLSCTNGKQEATEIPSISPTYLITDIVVNDQLKPTQTNSLSSEKNELTPSEEFYIPGGMLVFSSDEKIVFGDLSTKTWSTYGSPDEIIAYPVTTQDGNVYFLSDKGASHGMLELYRISGAGDIAQRITNDDFYDFYITSCYANNLVAYVSDQSIENGVDKVFVYGESNQSKPVEVLSQTKDILYLSCSADGKKLAYVISDDYHLGELFILDLGNGDIKQVTKNNSVKSLSLSPDGKKIVYISIINDEEKLFIQDISTGNVFEYLNSSMLQHLSSPSWSSDSSFIAFEAFDDRTQKLLVIDSMGSNEQELVVLNLMTNGFWGFNSAWSPDNKYIAYQIIEPDDVGKIFLINLLDRSTQELFMDYFDPINGNSWIPHK